MISDSEAANADIDLHWSIFLWNHESDLCKVFLKNYKYFIKYIAELQNVLRSCLETNQSACVTRMFDW